MKRFTFVVKKWWWLWIWYTAALSLLYSIFHKLSTTMLVGVIFVALIGALITWHFVKRTLPTSEKPPIWR